MSREDWQRRLGPLYGGAVALVHSTPWPWPTALGDEVRSPAWVVALGVPVGVVAWGVAAGVAAVGVAAPVAALLGLLALTVASAGLIERGLVVRVGQRLEPAGTEAPGVAGLIALVFVTLLRAAALLSIPRTAWLAVLVATAVIGRWAAVFLQALGDPIEAPGRGRSLVTTPPPAWLIAALSLGAAGVAILALGVRGVVAVALTALAAFGLGIDAQRRERGLSAPVVAVAAAAGELLVLAVATI